MIMARRYLFDWHKYSLAFILEDDLVLSPGYFNLCENIMQWCRERYPNVGMTSGWNELNESTNKEVTDPYKLEDVTNHFWGYLQSYQSWVVIRNILYTFEDLFLKDLTLYSNRNHQAIMQWKQHIYNQLINNRANYQPSFFPEEKQELVDKKCKAMVTGQDSVTLLAMHLTNQTRVAPVVARGLPIGKKGEHFSPEIFERKGFDKLVLYNNPSDSSQKEFSLCKETVSINMDFAKIN